jgi:hypothetical protein
MVYFHAEFYALSFNSSLTIATKRKTAEHFTRLSYNSTFKKKL